MTVGLSAARLLVLGTGGVVVVLGLYLIALPRGPGAIVGVYTVLLGLALIVGALIERVRYRSEAADRDGTPAGPAGGEPSSAALEPRFRRTDEVFVDPTTRQRMRVWLDPGSGERRYLADGPPERP
jgi:hypothetical protein